jgi:hypothetical protein
MSKKLKPETISCDQINDLLIDECNRIKDLLVRKNTDYNNSLYAKAPLFEIDPKIGLMARINDKLNRIKQVGLDDNTEDSLDDLIGYLIHLRISHKLYK